jgi:LysM repeat protein
MPNGQNARHRSEGPVAGEVAMQVWRLTALMLCAVLASACSTGGTPRRVGTTASTATSTSRPTRSTTTTTKPSVTYRVRRGDSLTTIANLFRVPISVIAKRNHIVNADRVAAGLVLMIPPAPPVTLMVSPPRGAPGQAFHFTVSGVQPTETITFEIDSAAGRYRGGPHIAANGSVTATYQTASGDPTGLYGVTATGNMGTTVRASFTVVAATTNHT